MASNIAVNPAKVGLKSHQLELLLKTINDQKLVEDAWLFGSRALGTYKDSSDVDIAIDGSKLSLQVVADMLDILEQSSLPYKVDLVVKSKITSPDLIEHIENFGLKLK